MLKKINQIKTLFNYKHFSIKISDKDKRLNQFFQLPKNKLSFPDNVLDHPDEELSVVDYNEEEIDKMDMIEKLITKKKLESKSKINNFFKNLTNRETIKLSENLVERLRLNKEFKFSDDFKEKEISNEYGNYDKFMENYKVVKDREYDSNDEGESTWAMNFHNLQEKYNNRGTEEDKKRNNKDFEDKIREDITRYGNNFKFIDYLQMKQKEKFGMLNISTKLQKNTYFTDSGSKSHGAEGIGRAQINPRIEVEEDSDDPFEEDHPLKRIKPHNIEQYREDIRKKWFRKKPDRDPNIKFTRKEKESFNNFIFYGAVEKKMKKMKPFFIDDDSVDVLFEKERATLEKRASPYCKQEIFKAYLEGWTIKDLSYKYGMLPERVKAIIWCKDYFWKYIYPKIGESGLRERLDEGKRFTELHHPYVDYGIDLEAMAYREQGMKLVQISRSELDCKPTREIEEKISPVFRNIKKKKIDYVPIRFIGKGPTGYLLKEMNVNQGRGARRVSQMFRRYLYWKDKAPQTLPDRVVRKISMGPRLATLGYRF